MSLRSRTTAARRAARPTTRATVKHGGRGGELMAPTPIVSWRRPAGPLLTIHKGELPPGAIYCRDIIGTDGTVILVSAGSLLIWEASR